VVAFSCVLSCDFVHPLFLFHTLLISLPLSPVATSPTKQRRTSSTHTQINNLIHTWCQVCLYAKAMCCAYPHISGRMQWWTGDRTCYYPSRRSRRLKNQPSAARRRTRESCLPTTSTGLRTGFLPPPRLPAKKTGGSIGNERPWEGRAHFAYPPFFYCSYFIHLSRWHIVGQKAEVRRTPIVFSNDLLNPNPAVRWHCSSENS
jgi:hypothetical protein